MKLDRMVLVNWGQMVPGVYEFGGKTLLTGESGAGKSTMLDALQTVMTAVYQGIYNYNPGQEEVSQGQRNGKTKRTLESFIVGAEKDSFSRVDGAHGYIALVFRPDPGEETARVFSAIVAASARVDKAGARREAKLEQMEMIIVDDEAVTLEDFQVDADAGQYVAVEEIYRRLSSRYKGVRKFDNHKRDYLCALYGRFRGRQGVTWDEAQNAAKAWCQSIAYRPIGSVSDLVRDDILEFNAKALNESITRISDLMQQVTTLKREGARLLTAVKQLDALTDVAGKATAAHEDVVFHHALLARIHQRDDDEEIDALMKRKKDLGEEIDRKKALAEEKKGVKASRDATRVQITAQLSGIPAYADKGRLEGDLERDTRLARGTLKGLAESVMAAARLEGVARNLLGRAIPEQFPQLRTSVEAVGRSLAATELNRLAGLRVALLAINSDQPLVPTDLASLASGFKGANEGLDELYQRLMGPYRSVAMAIASEERGIETRVEQAGAALKDINATLQRLSQGGGDYPKGVAPALELIRKQYPGADVQVLCDLVEPLSIEWQQAIEGYMDGARFNLIVRQDYEGRVMDLLQSVSSRVKVIQGSHCLKNANSARVPVESILHELHTDNSIAKAYLTDQFGGVVKVETIEQLRFTSRGLMKDGRGSGSRTMFVSGHRSLAFGKAARAATLDEYTEKKEAASRQLTDFEEFAKGLKDIQRSLNGLKEPQFNAQPLEVLSGDLANTIRALAQLDLTEASELAGRLREVTENIKELEDEIEQIHRDGAVAGQNLKTADEALVRVSARIDSRRSDVQSGIGQLGRLCEINKRLAYPLLAKRVDEHLQSRLLTASDVQQLLSTKLESLPRELFAEVRGLLTEYNLKARTEERFEPIEVLIDPPSFDPYYIALLNLGNAASQLCQQMRGVGLYNNREEVEGAERSFHDVFTKQFCAEIKTKVDDGVRTLRQLNVELEKLKFGGDRFQIDWGQWVPEYEEYYRFFEAVIELASPDSEETVDLFGAVELSDKQIAVRDRLRDLLLDEDQARAGRELMRIADYRNYRVYEIWAIPESGNRVALSTWGTGSGGQMETPAYLVRASIVTNRLKIFEKGPSLKLLMSDESFSKMDEQRPREVLRFLNEGLNLQVVCSIPTRAVGGLREEFNREYSFSRLKVPVNGEIDFVTDVDERILKTDKMRELWAAQRAQAREQGRIEFEKTEPRPLEEAAHGAVDDIVAVGASPELLVNESIEAAK